jgi:hypothetical protein
MSAFGFSHSAATAHPYTQPLVEASANAFAYFEGNVDDPNVDAVLELETFTDALGEAFKSMGADVSLFAAWLETEFPSYPGLAAYYEALAATFIASSEAASEAMTAHRAINAPDFERRENPRPREDRANVPISGVI